jgi:superfamily I DNA/RNA helicase
VAVLFRTTRQCDIFAEVFQQAGIPFQIASKDHTFVDKGVGAILSFLKILEQSGSYMDMERVIQYSASGLGPKTVKTWLTWALDNHYALLDAVNNTRRFPIKGLKKDKQLKLVQFFDTLKSLGVKTNGWDLKEKIYFVLDNTAMGEKAAIDQGSLEKLVEKSKEFQNTKSLVQAIALQTDTDLFEANTEKVTLMTMHASKGLEFPVVFIAGCEEGYLPFLRDGEHTDIEEERRLLYVAMTRARQALYLSYAKKRTVFGKRESREPSRFIRDIEQNLMNYHYATGGRSKKKGHTQLELFST